MSTVETKERAPEASPRFKARMAGVFEALEGLTSAGGQVFIHDRLVVSGNAAATAASLLAHERLYWLGFGLSLIAAVFHIVWALLFYQLFKPVNRTVSLLAALIMFVGCALQAVTSLLYIAPLLILKGGGALSAFPPDQLQALAYAFLKLNSQSFAVYLVFFGFWCVLSGYLIARSTFMPRILGVLLAIDGLGWILYLHTPLAYQLFPVIAAASGIAEIPLQLWLLVFGVNPQRWKERAGAAGA
ncbi:MAG TPA: DUF4386 domain-containing protein [Candidatus Eisenbacteria bacterium]